MQILIGADPEVFVRDKRDKLISGHFFSCGTKENPMPVANGHVQNDGMALEFNVPPSKTKDEFVRATSAVIKDLTAIVHAKDPGCKLAAIPVADFGEEYISKVPLENSQLGCNPDFNAYTMMHNETPNASLPFRTGSGHIHIGWTTGLDVESALHIMQCSDLVKELDYYLGLPSLLWDDDNRRRELYGRAGAFRPKPYGLEYRVMSNAWLKRPDLIAFVFERAKRAALNILSPTKTKKPLSLRFGDVAQQIIDSDDLIEKRNWPKQYQAICSAVMNDRRM